VQKVERMQKAEEKSLSKRRLERDRARQRDCGLALSSQSRKFYWHIYIMPSPPLIAVPGTQTIPVFA